MSNFWSGDLGLTLVTISLAALIFIIYPLQVAGLPGRFFFDLIMLVLMISGALTVRQGRLTTVFMIVIVVMGAVVLWFSWFTSTLFTHKLASFFSVVTSLLYVRIVLHIMFRSGQVTWSRLQGGVCAYLLIGLAWASAYELIELFYSHSFHFVSPPADMNQLTSKLVYFSFATLTTVGFGDVTPLHPAARSLAIGEAIVGQLLPAILIATLVSMALQPHSKS